SSHGRGSSWYSAYSSAAATSQRSATPSPNVPSEVPRSELVPRVLDRSTARSARAGSRFAAFRSTWLSIMPPWVGSGWRQISVATGGRLSGTASSPTSVSPSAVCSSMSVRRAGRTVDALISIPVQPLALFTRLGTPPARAGHAARRSVPPAQRAPVDPVAPAGGVPVPPLLGAARPVRPAHHVRHAGPDLLLAAGAPVHPVGGPGHMAHDPLPIRRVLFPVDP